MNTGLTMAVGETMFAEAADHPARRESFLTFCVDRTRAFPRSVACSRPYRILFHHAGLRSTSRALPG